MVWRVIYYAHAKGVWMIGALTLSSVYVKRCFTAEDRRWRHKGIVPLMASSCPDLRTANLTDRGSSDWSEIKIDKVPSPVSDPGRPERLPPLVRRHDIRRIAQLSEYSGELHW